jgi:hypothetical protein
MQAQTQSYIVATKENMRIACLHLRKLERAQSGGEVMGGEGRGPTSCTRPFKLTKGLPSGFKAVQSGLQVMGRPLSGHPTRGSDRGWNPTSA